MMKFSFFEQFTTTIEMGQRTLRVYEVATIRSRCFKLIMIRYDHFINIICEISVTVTFLTLNNFLLT